MKKKIPEETKSKLKHIKREIEEVADELSDAGFAFSFIATDESGDSTTKLMYGDTVMLIGMMGMGIKVISKATGLSTERILEMMDTAFKLEALNKDK